MSARLLALLCLLHVSTAVGYSASINRDLVVYLRAQPDAAPAPLVEMKQQLAALMESAGFHLQWRNLGTPQQEGETSSLIIVEMRGVCRVPAKNKIAAPSQHPFSLASSSVVDGRVLPFSWLDCSALNRFLGPSLAKESKTAREYLYGRAMARLLAHEFYHVVAQTEEHTSSGLTKPRFSVNDLLTDRFEFEDTALSKLRSQPDEVAHVSNQRETETFAGR
jgi:hypothetical protein